MRIGEVAELTGLSISNIRFYEKKGLLQPVRDPQSKYREYTEDDVYRLKQILLYRKMDFSIELVREILEEEPPLKPVLDGQISELKKKKEMLQASIDLCEEIRKKERLAETDIDYYLNYVKKEEASGRKFADVEELLTDFASYTEFDRWLADPRLPRFVRKPKVMRAIRIIWSVSLLLLPIIYILLAVEEYLSGEGIRAGNMLICVLLFIVFWGTFVRFWMGRRKNMN